MAHYKGVRLLLFFVIGYIFFAVRDLNAFIQPISVVFTYTPIYFNLGFKLKFV